VEPKAGEEAFAAALFQDFAIPIMYAVAKEAYSAVLADVSISARAQLERERAMFRLDHAEVGRLVAQRLELPALFVDGVAFHHNHASLGGFVQHAALTDAMYVASLFPHVLDKWNPDDAAELRQFVAAHQRPGKPLDVDAYLAEVQREYAQLYAYFEGGKTPELNLSELLSVATREVADNTARSAGKEIHQVLARSSELEEAAIRDPLTGALNRDGLAKQGGELLASAGRYGSPFAIAYCDVDHFKELNDSLGHDAGDAALRKLAEIARGSARPTDVFARLGGDEFVLLIGDCPELAAGEVVQRIIDEFAATGAPPASDGRPATTISVGLLCVSGRTQAMPLEPLLTAADKLMYRAKGAGGNQAYRRALDAATKAA
jgi:diguanylate cyclase (GGDEF)-like protein